MAPNYPSRCVRHPRQLLGQGVIRPSLLMLAISGAPSNSLASTAPRHQKRRPRPLCWVCTSCFALPSICCACGQRGSSRIHLLYTQSGARVACALLGGCVHESLAWDVGSALEGWCSAQGLTCRERIGRGTCRAKPKHTLCDVWGCLPPGTLTALVRSSCPRGA